MPTNPIVINTSHYCLPGEYRKYVTWGVNYTIYPHPYEDDYTINFSLWYKIPTAPSKTQSIPLICNIDGGTISATLNVVANQAVSDWTRLGGTIGHVIERRQITETGGSYKYTTNFGISSTSHIGAYNLCPLTNFNVTDSELSPQHTSSDLTITSSQVSGLFNLGQTYTARTSNNQGNITQEVVYYWFSDDEVNFPNTLRAPVDSRIKWLFTTNNTNKQYSGTWGTNQTESDWRLMFHGKDNFQLHIRVYTYPYDVESVHDGDPWAFSDYTYTIWRGNTSFKPLITTVTMTEENNHLKALFGSSVDKVVFEGVSNKKIAVTSTKQYNVAHSTYLMLNFNASRLLSTLAGSCGNPTGDVYAYNDTFTGVRGHNFQVQITDEAGNSSDVYSIPGTDLAIYENQDNAITKCYISAEGKMIIYGNIKWTPRIYFGDTPNSCTSAILIREHSGNEWTESDKGSSYLWQLHTESTEGLVVDSGTTFNKIGSGISATSLGVPTIYYLYAEVQIPNFDVTQKKTYDVRLRTRDTIHTSGQKEYKYADLYGVPCAPVFDFSLQDMCVNVPTKIDNADGIIVGNGAGQTSTLAKLHNDADNRIDVGAGGGHVYIQGTTHTNGLLCTTLSASSGVNCNSTLTVSGTANINNDVNITGSLNVENGLDVAWGTNAHYHEITQPSGSDEYKLKVIPIANGFCLIAGWVHSSSLTTAGVRTIKLPFTVNTIVNVDFTPSWTPGGGSQSFVPNYNITTDYYTGSSKDTFPYKFFLNGSLSATECYFYFNIMCKVS